MTEHFRRGLVVGKFCPLHLGHEHLIDHARQHCDDILIISYAKPGFAGHETWQRARWLRSRYPTVRAHVIDDEILAALCRDRAIAERVVPHDDAPDDVHRRFVAWLLRDLLELAVDAVFTSEDYGDGFAAVLSGELGAPVTHASVDRDRLAVPVSGTRVREQPSALRTFLSPEVFASFVPRVAILGGESTGKSTLAQALARRLDTAWVPEYGRELWELRNGELSFDDLLDIGETQVDREEAAASTANGVLICDTTPLTTMLYSEVMFGTVARGLERLADRRYDVTLLCEPDFDFVQDGTRRDEAFRRRGQRWYVDALKARGIEPVRLDGALDRRVETALAAIAPLLAQAPATSQRA